MEELFWKIFFCCKSEHETTFFYDMHDTHIQAIYNENVGKNNTKMSHLKKTQPKLFLVVFSFLA